jgi:ABC-type transporter Mla subunit MlaD
MPQNAARNRIAAGAFLLVALAAGVTVLVLVGGWETWTQEMQTINVRFKAAPNIKIGNPVLLAGHPIGRVEKTGVVESACPAGSKRPMCYMVQVAMSIPKEYVIHKDARILISQALVGQSAVINIEDVGFGDKATDFVMGGEASPFAGAAGEVGIGEKERQSVGEIIEDVRLVAASLKTDLPGIIEKVKAAGDNLAAGTQTAKETVAELKQVVEENRENVKTAIANTKGATENVVATTQNIQQIVAENREDIHQTIAHAHSVLDSVAKETDAIVANVRAASNDLKTSVADFKAIAGDAKALVATNRGNIATALQNFRETSDHLLALSKEVRRAPWRLFATPDKKEVESLNLYDSARAFASAATDIQTCADTLQVMIEARKEGVDVNPEILKGMLKRLEETFEKYQEAEKVLLKEFERIQK